MSGTKRKAGMESRRENVKDKSKENCKYIKKAYVLWK
jgi:hypothetical protein